MDVQVEPDYHNHLLNLTFKCLTTRSAKRGQMYDSLQMVVGPTFRFTKLNPTGNFKYSRGHPHDLRSEQMSCLPSIRIPYVTQNKAPIQRQHVFSHDAWTGLKPCDFCIDIPQCASTRFLMICILRNHS